MFDVQNPVKASRFRQHLFEYLDSCREEPIIIERGTERWRLSAAPRRRALGVAPLSPMVNDPDGLPEFSPSSWNGDDIP